MASLARPVQICGGTVGKDQCQHNEQDHRDDPQVPGIADDEGTDNVALLSVIHRHSCEPVHGAESLGAELD